MFDLDSPSSSPINERFSIFIKLPTELSEEVEIVVRADGCEIVGSNTRVVPIGSNNNGEERFRLNPRKLGEQKIQVDVYENNKNIARMSGKIEILGDPASDKDNTSDRDRDTTLKIEIDRLEDNIQNYLRLSVHQDKQNPQVFNFLLTSIGLPGIDYKYQKIGQITLHSSPEEKINSIYKELGHLATVVRKLVPKSEPHDLTETLPEEALEALENVGHLLWEELIPKTLQDEYWRFKSVVNFLMITSDEPWIPWEMIKPYNYDKDGIKEEEPFWCEQFAISRWLTTKDNYPPRDLAIGLTIAVSPQNTDLANAKLEVEFLQQLNSLQSSISHHSPIHTAKEIKKYILNENFAILHFACHGMFDSTLPDNSAINLTDGKLSPTDIRRKFIEPRPIVFINACNSSRIGFSFTKMGGWAQKFVEAQVGVFIGAMWEVSDELALEFAKTFYTALLQDNLTIGEAFKKSRQAVREIAPNNSTWLAYSLYGNPDARIRLDLTRSS